MPVFTDSFQFLASQIVDAETQWSLGTFGAIAEFVRVPGEPCAIGRSATALSAATARGGLRIEPAVEMRLVAFETTTSESWSQRVALCLREDRCAMNRRNVLTEAGPDAGALREQDRTAVLFDLGIDALQADVFVRVSAPDIIARLRQCAGRPLLDPANPAMAVILATNPHRVFVSRLGRIEVYQPIPPHDGKSPEGPHTHVLPNLLRHRRTHAATEQIPEGWVPCAHLYPAHPAKDGMGRARPFDLPRHTAFQDILRTFGDPEFISLKQQVVNAVAAGDGPEAIAIAAKRFARTNVRVALRQIKAAQIGSASLADWLAAHEHSQDAAAHDDRQPHHR